MSSDNKKSVGSLVLLLLIFVAIAGASWFFFNNKNKDTAPAEQEVTEQTADSIEGKTSTPHDHDHNHNKASNSPSGEIGIKGKIQQLNPPAIYGERGVGNPNAPIKIQEFFSLTCNHCASFHKTTYQKIKSELIDTGKVYFVYEEFPLNGPALYGSMIARCLPKARYAGFVDILLRTQAEWAFSGDFKAALMQTAKLAGMSEEEFNTCFDNKDLQKAVAVNIKEASDLWKINSTPSFIVNNGERIIYGGKPYESFEKLVAQLTGEETDKTEPAIEEETEDKAE